MFRLIRIRNPSLYLLCKPRFNSSSKERDPPPPTLPEEPTNCCMSGCANCVWIEYAKELTKIYSDGGDKAKELILQKITDPSLKMFLQMELRALEKEAAKKD